MTSLTEARKAMIRLLALFPTPREGNRPCEVHNYLTDVNTFLDTLPAQVIEAQVLAARLSRVEARMWGKPTGPLNRQQPEKFKGAFGNDRPKKYMAAEFSEQYLTEPVYFHGGHGGVAAGHGGYASGGTCPTLADKVDE